MRLNLNPARLKLAVDAAVSKWRHSSDGSDRNSERYFHKQFTKQKPTEEDFASWLGLWMIARNSPKKTRAKLLDGLWKHNALLKNIKVGNSTAFKSVDNIAVQLQKDHLTKDRVLSLVSKFAFTLNPAIFIPFDSRVRKGLRRLGHSHLKPPYSYEVYMKCVNHEHESVGSLLAAGAISTHIKRRMREFRCSESERKLIEMRVMDKTLMLVGGFKSKNMRNEFDKAREAAQR